MPHPVDLTRRRLQLSPAALAAAVLLLPGPLSGRVREAVADELRTFETVGLVEDGWLVRWAAELVALVVAPDLVVTVVCSAGADHSTTRIWACPEAAAVGDIADDGTVTLWSAAPTMLAWTLAASVGLGPRPNPASPGSRIDVAALARGAQAMLAGEHRSAPLGRDDLRPDAAGAPAMALLPPGRSRAWRVTAQWTAPDGSAVLRSLAVVDGEEAGLWRSDPPHPAGVTEEGSAVFVPATFAEVWQRLVDLLPPGTCSSPDEEDAHPGSPACQQPLQPTRAPSAASPAIPRTWTPA